MSKDNNSLRDSFLQDHHYIRALLTCLDASLDGFLICEVKAGYPIVYVSEGFCAFTGYKAEEILGRSCSFLQGPKTDSREVDKIRQALAEEKPYQGQITNYHKEGAVFHNELNLQPLYNEAGLLTHYVGVQRDVTSTINQLESLTDRYKMTQQAAGIGSWEWNIKTNEVWWSEQAYALCGVSPESFTANFDSFLNLLDSASAKSVTDRVQIILKDGIPYQHDIRLKNNNKVVLHGKCILVRDDEGEPAFLMGTIQDISESVLKEKQ